MNGQKTQEISPIIRAEIEYPSVQVNYLNTSSVSNIKTPQSNLPNKLPIYQIIPHSQTTEQASEKIANSFGFRKNDSATDNTPIFISYPKEDGFTYTWHEGAKVLIQSSKSGVFELTAPFIPSNTPENSQAAKELVLNVLASNGLIPSSYDITIEHLLLPNFSISAPDNFSIYRVNITPKANGFAVLSYKNNGSPISAYINRDLTFFKFDYLYAPISKTNQMLNLKIADEAIKNILELKINPTFIYLPLGFDSIDPSSVQISKITINSVELVYYLDSKISEYLYPTYKITAAIETVDKNQGTATYLAPAY